MKKISIAMVALDLRRTGISTVIMNYCRNIDKSKFQVDLLVGNVIVAEYRNECEKMGVQVIELPLKHNNVKKYISELSKNLSKKKYDIIHVHGNSATITLELFIAWLKRIPVRIAHCHNTTCNHVKMDKVLKPFFNLLYTNGFACSDDAGKWMFGNRQFDVIPNGFNTKIFKFSLNQRNVMRDKLNINGKFVMGHVGMFNHQKNHEFLLKVFENIVSKNSDTYLLLVGDGPDKDKICEIINNSPYKDRIIVYGSTNTPEKLYCAMDVFVFPSRHEGLGIVVLEAQINGLPCIVSDVIPSEAIISDNVKLLSLNDSIENWTEGILNHKEINREDFYKNNLSEIRLFDIAENTKYLEEKYIEFANKKGII